MKEKGCMHFKYQLHNAYVPMSLWIKLVIHRIFLMNRRLLRLCKRIIIYLKKYIPIIICVIAFEMIVIPFGIGLEKYDSWIDGFWDLRNFMLTSIIISVVVGILSAETKRHKELVKQYRVYESFKYASENFINSLCRIADVEIERDIFMSENKFDSFYKELEEEMKNTLPGIKNKTVVEEHLLYSTKELSRTIAIKLYFEHYFRELENVNKTLLIHEFIGTIDHAIEQVDYIYNEMQAERLLMEEQSMCYTDIQLLKFVDCISRVIYPAIADLRRPWRWDQERNNKMTEIIAKYKITERTYDSMREE